MDHLTRLDTKQAQIGILNQRVQPTQPYPLDLHQGRVTAQRRVAAHPNCI